MFKKQTVLELKTPILQTDPENNIDSLNQVVPNKQLTELI